MNSVYIFDMDGTLTPPRKPMTDFFAKKFEIWLKQNEAYIATGSDYSKVKEQLLSSVISLFSGIYCSMGNELWLNDKPIYQKEIELEQNLLDDLNNFRINTKYPYELFQNFLEKRIGMLNFSILGRDCPYDARIKYAEWDAEHKERKTIQEYLTSKYSQYNFLLGGTISIDIVKKSCGKEQIAEDLRLKNPNSRLVFFGDRTFKGGNDYELAYKLSQMENTKTVQVDSPEELLKILEHGEI